MAYKQRTKSKVCLIYEVLAQRMDLTRDDAHYLQAMQKGYQGECQFDEYTEKIQDDCLILNDLLLRNSRNLFQIDTLIITGDVAYLYEIKNFKGEYRWDTERLIKSNGPPIENPMLQLNKTKVRLEILLEKLGYLKKVQPYLVFIHPEFTLTGFKENEQYLLRSQISRHLLALNQNKTRLTPSDTRLAKNLLTPHVPEYQVPELPEYAYDQLKKGLPCVHCGSLTTSLGGQTLYCTACREKSVAAEAICRGIKEFQLLFPNEKITTKRMQDWCAVDDRFRIYRNLTSCWTPCGKGPHRYYV